MFKKKISSQEDTDVLGDTGISNVAMFFAKDDEFSADFRKGHKAVGSIVLDDIKHSLFIEKKGKLPKGFSSSFLSLCIYDSKIRGSDRAYYFSAKTKELLLFVINDAEVSLDIIKMSDEEDVSMKAENRFVGNPYVEILGNEKELSSQYQKNQTVLLMILVVAILGLSYGGYITMFAEDEVTVVQKTPPPKPVVKPLDVYEESILKNKLSIDVLTKVVEEIDTFKDRGAFDIKRISSIDMGRFEQLPPSEPTLNEETNTWVYEGEAERLRRGGYEARVVVDYQQKFPSNGYTLEIEGNDEKIPLYKKTETFTFKVYGVDVENKENNLTSKTMDKSCLNRTLRVVSGIFPFANKDQYIDFTIKRTLPSYFYYDIKTLMARCPLEFITVSVRDGEFMSDMSMLKLGKQDVVPPAQEN